VQVDESINTREESTGIAEPVPQARPAGKASHPLGPLFYRLEAHRPREARARAVVVIVVCLSVMGLARALEPDPRGLGTHSQLGIGECGFPLITGYPCPTCGMTTAFAHTVRGQWWAAFNAHPAGWALCVALMATIGFALSVLITGRTWHVNWYRLPPFRTGLAVVALLLFGWAYKIVVGLANGTLPVTPAVW
jgi:hypothetical protein